jgi:hypothetical protein
LGVQISEFGKGIMSFDYFSTTLEEPLRVKIGNNVGSLDFRIMISEFGKGIMNIE